MHAGRQLAADADVEKLSVLDRAQARFLHGMTEPCGLIDVVAM